VPALVGSAVTDSLSLKNWFWPLSALITVR
jgi:hypothetical protein